MRVAFEATESAVVRTSLELSDEGGVQFSVSGTPGVQLCRQIEQWMEEYASRKVPSFPLPIKLTLLPHFTTLALAEVSHVPWGEVATYGEIAMRIGNPRASRAVGSACRRNPLPLLIPCHRIISPRGFLRGFAFGLELKEQLLHFENLTPSR